MTLISSWINCLQIFKPKNFFSFIQQSINLYINTYKTWLKSINWESILSIILLPICLWSVYIQHANETINHYFRQWNQFWVLGIDIVGLITNNLPFLLVIYGILTTLFIEFILSSKLTTFKPAEKLEKRFDLLLWFLALPYIWQGWKLLWPYIGLGYTWDRPGSIFGLIIFFLFVLFYIFFIAAFNIFFSFQLFGKNGSFQNFLKNLWITLKIVIYSLPFWFLMGCILWLVGSIIVPIRWAIFSLLNNHPNYLGWTNLITDLLEFLIFLPLVISIFRQFYNETFQNT